MPKRGQATFFSYKGPDGRMDDGYTEHSGCPVLEGACVVVCVLLVFLSGVILKVSLGCLLLELSSIAVAPQILYSTYTYFFAFVFLIV